VVHPKKKKKKKGKAATPPAPPKTVGVVYLRKTYETWRLDLIKLLSGLCESDGTFAKTAMTKVVDLAKEVDTLSRKDLTGKEKKLWEKQLRSKAAFIIKNVNGGDASYLEATLPFDEMAVIKESSEYIAKSLGLTELKLVDADAAASPDPDNGAKEAATPGDPKIWAY